MGGVSGDHFFDFYLKRERADLKGRAGAGLGPKAKEKIKGPKGGLMVGRSNGQAKDRTEERERVF